MHEQAIVSATSSGAKKLCSLTKRVMIISPYPERLESLYVSLSSACFDVFSLHEFNEGLLSALKPELIVYDTLPLEDEHSDSEQQREQTLLRIARSYPIPLVALRDERAGDLANEELDGVETLLWPSAVDGIIEHINDLLENQLRHAHFNDLHIYKDLKIDLKRMIVMREDERIDLTKTEYDLLLHFLNSDGSVQTREMLLEIIWGLQFYAGSNVVDVHIKSLRKKLEDSAVDPKYIVTVRGAGYRLADL
ncbi:response regulator transcription factor [Paenibacillus sp. FSL W7-1287]|uniref:response regulator transcription factor n=1 Tax=Paenibacillus sp. FSL W7-1287 TaxID=2954538 RepID=UPI0030F5C2AC